MSTQRAKCASCTLRRFRRGWFFLRWRSSVFSPERSEGPPAQKRREVVPLRILSRYQRIFFGPVQAFDLHLASFGGFACSHFLDVNELVAIVFLCERRLHFVLMFEMSLFDRIC